ncbi:unnamed protein product [Bursaphelenchus xylophilus]|uniref:(pine wood nematode) hypothetical protein n=1 Tax=Bursaphelenchus xylophilus TaxID=6326 RepID=A0A1I7RM96_BURXY|nr:unnamed protein product [Bursaphelenchus xylophilus]CAG9118320.1 unnamed protein product [Bursaphelenchus xylophilus]
MSDRDPLQPTARTPWNSIYITSALTFVSAVQYSLYFTSLWPYMKILDPEINASFFGITVFCYSFGQIVAAPVFGKWSNKVKQVKQPLSAGLIFMFVGNLLYILMEVLPGPKRFILLVCRLILGFGSGNLALLRTYAATASLPQDKSKSIAYVTCGQALGMSLGPAFQVVFTVFGYPGISFFGLHINIFTSPAYFAALTNIAGAIFLHKYFEELYAEELEDDDEPVIGDNHNHHRTYDRRAVMVCYVTRFVDKYVRTNLETLGPPLAMMMFAFDKIEAVKYPSIAQGLVGAITFLTYIVFINFRVEQYLKLRTNCILALVFMIIFHFLTYPYAFYNNHVKYTNETGHPEIGCNVARYQWCFDLTAVNPWLYYLTYVVFIGVSFPVLTVSLSTLFSKILGPRRQGTQQGWLQVWSSLGRMFGAMASSSLYVKGGPRPVWQMEIAVIGAVIAAWFLFFNRMIAYQPVRTAKSDESENSSSNNTQRSYEVIRDEENIDRGPQ